MPGWWTGRRLKSLIRRSPIHRFGDRVCSVLMLEIDNDTDSDFDLKGQYIMPGDRGMVRVGDTHNKSSVRHGCALAFVMMAAVVLTAGTLAGCAGSGAKAMAEPVRVPSAHAVAAAPAAPAGPSDGSLWDERGGLGTLFANNKARQVGDIVTVRIVESATATNKATTKTDRSTSLSAGLDSFFGAEKRHPADSPFFNPFGKVAGNIGSEFEGTGSTERRGDLTAYMTARVVDVLPNGTLAIEGNREVRVNHENQLITLTGLVRPRDISADNVIQSTYIADARIAYSGKGVLNDRQKPGWLVRALDKVWPF